jgi:peptide/nickel transport system ATP-binding protein
MNLPVPTPTRRGGPVAASSPEPKGPKNGPGHLLQVEDLSLSLGHSRLLYDVSFDVSGGEVVGLVGESGSGKTLTGLSILGLLPAGARVGGRVQFGGEDLLRLPAERLRSLRGRQLSMIFQEPRASLNPSLTIGRQITDVIRTHQAVSRRQAYAMAEELFHQVGLPAPRLTLKTHSHELSGGMCQRVMIAMALVCEPKLLIADEPTTALDVTIQAQIVDLLRRLADERAFSVLLISHNLGVITEVCDRVITMYAGEVVNVTWRDQLLLHPSHPYAWSLLNAARRMGGQGVGRAGAQPANSARPPQGCRFHPRCPFAQDRCHEVHPALMETEHGSTRCLRHAEVHMAGLESP